MRTFSLPAAGLDASQVRREVAATGMHDFAATAVGTAESLAAIRDAARRERLLDMEQRLRRYRTACFAILALALAAVGPELGWWWMAPLAAGFAGFAVADRFMRASAHPALWVAAAWGLLPLLLADAVRRHRRRRPARR